MTIKVLYFASLTDLMGCQEQTLELSPGSTVDGLLTLLEEQHPALKSFQRRFRVAQNQEFVPLETALVNGAEIALIPPVSGGASAEFEIAISAQTLSPERALNFVRRNDCGAVVTFLGTVRELTGEQVTERLDYSAYQTMAEKELEKICVEAAEMFAPLGALHVSHRVGSLLPGEIAVVVAVSAPHRKGAFEAARYLIDAAKERVPLWKKEIGPNGEAWVEGDARVASNP